MEKQVVTILGSTGSIGQNTLDVIARHTDKFDVYAISAYTRIQELAQQAYKFDVKVVVVPNNLALKKFKQLWPNNKPIPEILVGNHALCEIASATEVTTVMAAIVGAAGLPPTLAAAQNGKRILLANKESLVAAGDLFMKTVRENNVELLPIDSEHNAIFQCLPKKYNKASNSYISDSTDKSISRILLTASGGPFLETPIDKLQNVTPQQACAHPNWKMGKKISVDSATMLNKGLEVIEAHWLFDMPSDKIEVVIHPQSIIHSMVEYHDGSILAQLGQPDMRTPIAFGLGFPERIASGLDLMDITKIGNLQFSPPDLNRFPCLKLSYNALESGQAACIALNAANEVAVDSFLNNKISFTSIQKIIEKSINKVISLNNYRLSSLSDILELDALTRDYAFEACA